MTGCSFHGFLLPCAVHLEAREAFSGCICAKIQMAEDGCAGADMSSRTFWKKGEILLYMEDIREMLKKVAAGELSVDNAVLELKKEPFTAAGYDDLGFAKLDTHRKLRQGAAEVIYGAGKTPQQIAGIVEAMKKSGQETVSYTHLTLPTIA